MALVIQKVNDKELFVKFNYSPQKVNEIKTFKERRWDKDNKHGILPNTDEVIEKLQQIFNNEEIVFDEKLRRKTEKSNKSLIEFKLQGLLETIEKELKLKGYSLKTSKAYLAHIERMVGYYKKDVFELNTEDIRNYLLNLIDVQKKSHSYAEQAISSLKFLFKDVLHRSEVIEKLPRPKKEKKLPNILSEEEIFRLLEVLDNIKHKAMLFLVYSAGLRVSEVVRLKTNDIDD